MLDHYFLTPDIILKANRWGIPEPENAKAVSEEQIDLILVPLLTFDKKGHRVGYGKGYYDRFLAKCKPEALKLGLSFDEPITKIIDTNEWDVKLDYCITPNQVWNFQ